MRTPMKKTSAKVVISPKPSRESQLRVLTRTWNEAMHSHALRLPAGARPRFTLGILLEVALAEVEGREVHVEYLRARLGFTQSSTSRNVQAHLKARTLETYVTEYDGRKTCLRLTKAGRAFLNDVLDAMARQVAAERERQERQENPKV